MLFGSFEHTLDDKGRLVIPRKMREELGSQLFIMKGFDGALSIFKSDEFEKLINEHHTLSFNKKSARDYLRVQLASVCELEVDKAGRVQLPSSLITKYQIGKEVVVIGMGDHIEVWNKALYEEYEKTAIADFETTAEKIDSKD